VPSDLQPNLKELNAGKGELTWIYSSDNNGM
jgi:hypothetical protein